MSVHYPLAMKFPWFVLAISLCMETLWGADIPALTKQAGTGNATAQYELAEIFAEGKGVARNPKLAVQYAAQSAAQGNAKALYRLAALVFEGKGATQDVGRASGLFKDCRKPLEELAKKGDADAQAKLGVLLMRGLSGPPEQEAAKEWTIKAAKQGNAKAQYDLGSLYLFGRVVKKDLTAALNWFLKGAKGGHPGAQVSYGIAKADGYGTARDLKEARKWLNLAAKSFDPDMVQRAKQALARIEAGDLQELPDTKAMKAKADDGNLDEQYRLGLVYHEGQGVEQNLPAAHELFAKAAKKGHARACNALGGQLIKGLGCKKDVAAAHHWWLLAAKSGLPDAQANLGLLLSRGEDGVVKKDVVEAYKWLTLAARAENPRMAARARSMREGLTQNMKGLEIFKGVRAAQGFKPVKIPVPAPPVKRDGE